MRLELLLDSLLRDELVPVELGLVEAAHLGLLAGDHVHDGGEAAGTLDAAGRRRRRVLLGLEELLGLAGVLVYLLRDSEVIIKVNIDACSSLESRKKDVLLLEY